MWLLRMRPGDSLEPSPRVVMYLARVDSFVNGLRLYAVSTHTRSS